MNYGDLHLRPDSSFYETKINECDYLQNFPKFSLSYYTPLGHNFLCDTRLAHQFRARGFNCMFLILVIVIMFYYILLYLAFMTLNSELLRSRLSGRHYLSPEIGKCMITFISHRKP